MQVVIDITESSWNELQAIKKSNSDSLKFWQKMITEGTSLPKNHGDLMDSFRESFKIRSTTNE